MGKRGRNQKKDLTNPKQKSRREYVDPSDLDDDIDTFHKQRDVIPLDINDDDRESSEDEEEPVFDDEDINDNEDEDDDEDKDDDDEEDSEDDDSNRFASKIKKQQKYIKEKFAIVDDEIHDEEDNGEDNKEAWGGKKPQYYGGKDYEGDSSDDEALKEEEEEILRLQRERNKDMSMADFGLQNVSEESEDDSERELTLEEITKGKSEAKGSFIEEVEKMDTIEEVKKDVNALSREEQMDVVYSSAPELVGLLSDLNDALEQLENRVNPLLSKVKNGGIILKGGIRYLEMKQLLLLAYCQAITFYLLLKSEGQPIRDHPVIARLVEIKSLLDKTKELDGSLPSEIEELLKINCGDKEVENIANGNTESESVRKDYSSSLVSSKADKQEPKEPSSTNELSKIEPSRVHRNKEKKYKHKTDQVGVRSAEMLTLRAALEEKLKQKGVFSSRTPKIDRAQKNSKSVNGQLETYDDFNEDAMDVVKGYHGLSNGHTGLVGSAKLSQLVSAKTNKPKVVSGDDDLPKRDDIGERRRKHELKVLAGAGIMSGEHNAGHELDTLETDEATDVEEDGDAGDSEEDFYRQVKEKRDAKLATKAAIYARNPTVPSLPETVEGKRHINYQIEKNRGLTRPRRKDLKNPRKKYRTKHDKEKRRRLGQVQQMRKQGGSYPGEQTGINAGISRSIRFGN